MATPIRIVVEKHPDGYVAYPLGIARGVIVGQGDSYEEALADVRSARLSGLMPSFRNSLNV